MDSPERQELRGLVLAMPEQQVREVLAFTREVLAKAKIDISFEWTDEDMRDFSRGSMEHANRSMPWEGEEFPPTERTDP